MPSHSLSPSRTRLLALPVLMLAMALAAAACGGGKTPAPAGNLSGPASFDVSLGDNFFEPKEFAVKAGQQVTFSLSNDGAAIHNMRIAGRDNKYNTKDDAVSDPGLVNAGDSATLAWTAPTKAGTIKLRCDFHPNQSTGTIIVE
ncbi:MAG TPA: cupredoxin domain-containing protein [Dehalococcoidia bacterium]|nr:cupredoxin domain-containing protein [Dehalococcoidia bacterium]